MHFSIPDTQESKDENGTSFTVRYTFFMLRKLQISVGRVTMYE